MHSLARLTTDALAGLLAPIRNPPRPRSSPHRRFLSGRAAAEGPRFLAAARAYVAGKSAEEAAWLYRKPYDRNPGNPGFYTEVYQVLNLLQAMRIRPFGRVLEEETARFGTLESPFTQDYLDGLLARHGFVEIQRYHAINGLFRREEGRCTLEELAPIPLWDSNNLTARKPTADSPAATSADPDRITRARISLLRRSPANRSPNRWRRRSRSP